jgi:hypothetical protein
MKTVDIALFRSKQRLLPRYLNGVNVYDDVNGRSDLPEILRQDGFVVCIHCELGGRHHLPHCHLRWGDEEAVVSLTTIQVLVGDDPPPHGRAILIENAELLPERRE